MTPSTKSKPSVSQSPPRSLSNTNDQSNSKGSEADSQNSAIFETDDFKIWCMKVIPCTKRFVHDWTVCPFAHTGEKAVRRDPRKFTYTGIACPDMKGSGECIRGDACPYAHNVFEYWLHPTRYRTQLCKDGPMCKRSICFFAHDLKQLRTPETKPYVSPEQLASASLMGIKKSQSDGGMLGGSDGGDAAALRQIRVTGRHQDELNLGSDSLVWTPYGSARASLESTPRVSDSHHHHHHDQGLVRASAPVQYHSRSPHKGYPGRASLDGSFVRRSTGGIEQQSDIRGSLDGYVPPETGNADSLADALAALRMSIQSSSQGSRSYDDVINTVHQVLQHALESKESSLRPNEHEGNETPDREHLSIQRSSGDSVMTANSSEIYSASGDTDHLSPVINKNNNHEHHLLHQQEQQHCMVDPWGNRQT
jgi:hypothetical protein